MRSGGRDDHGRAGRPGPRGAGHAPAPSGAARPAAGGCAQLRRARSYVAADIDRYREALARLDPRDLLAEYRAKGFLTRGQACRALGIGTKRLTDLIAEGRLKLHELPVRGERTRWFFRAEEVEASRKSLA